MFSVHTRSLDRITSRWFSYVYHILQFVIVTRIGLSGPKIVSSVELLKLIRDSDNIIIFAGPAANT